MGSKLSRGFKAVYSVFFFAIFSFILLNLATDALFDITKVILVIDYLIAIMQFLISFVGEIAVLIAGTITSFLSAGIPIPFSGVILNGETFYIHLPFFTDSNLGKTNTGPSWVERLTSGGYITTLIQSIFPQSSLFSSTTAADPVNDFLNVWGVTIAIILLPVIILSAIGFVVRGEARLAITSFVTLQLLIILAMYLPNSETSSGRMLLLDLSLPIFGGTVDTIGSDLILLVSSQVFLLGISLYVLLEISFQAAYAISVIDPMIDRERRIKEHLKRIDNFTPSPQKEKKTVTLGKGTAKKYDLLAASYLREMIERKIYKRGESELDDKATMRLQSYVSSLRRTDRHFVSTITAKSAQPRASAILKNLIPLVVLRIFFVIVLAFVILNPAFILDFVLINPDPEISGGFLNFPQLAESIELDQPEFRVVILFNIILLITVIAAILHWLLVHKPEVPERRIQRVDTLVDFQDIGEEVDADAEAEAEAEADADAEADELLSDSDE